MTMLLISHINQYYGGSHILRDVSLTAEPAQITVVLGRNGVGKTTLLKVIMGLVRHASGTLQLEGQEIGAMPPYARSRRGLAYVPQGREIFPRLTVEENLSMGLSNQDRKARIPEYLFELFPVLAQMRRRRGGDLSGGQQQQLAIARALAQRPRVLLLDEPTEGIQPSIIKEIERAIRTVVKTQGIAVVLVEQYYDFARALADTFVLMERGEVVAAGRGDEMDALRIQERLAV